LHIESARTIAIVPKRCCAASWRGRSTALNIREKFSTAAAVADATLDDLRACRVFYRPTDPQLEQLRVLACASIGTRDPGRIKSLTMQQKQVIAELRLLTRHVEEIDREIVATLENSREGCILASMPVIGPIQAAIFIANVGNIRNFSSVAALKSYCGWSPHSIQTGTTLDVVKLTRGGNPTLKHMLYLVAMTAVRTDTEWRDMYERLVPLKCHYDTRTQRYRGKMKVIGRVVGQVITVAYTLLMRDARLLDVLPEGEEPPAPVLYSRAIHKAHRLGSYQRADSLPLGTPLPIAEKLHNE